MVCKVLKKGILGAALGAGALAVLFGTAAPYYVKTAVHNVRHSASDAVPVQYDIDKARQQVSELEPAIRDNIEAIAKAEVEIEYLDREIQATEANLDTEAKALLALRQHLDDGNLKLTGGLSYTPLEIKSELARRLDHYRNIKSILTDKQETLKLRQKSLIAFREKNAEMRASKEALLTQIEGIETRLRQIEATQASNEFHFDDSALARAKQSIAELNKRVEVMARVSEEEGRYSGDHLPVILETNRDVASEVDAEFNLKGHAESNDSGRSL